MHCCIYESTKRELLSDFLNALRHNFIVRSSSLIGAGKCRARTSSGATGARSERITERLIFRLYDDVKTSTVPRPSPDC